MKEINTKLREEFTLNPELSAQVVSPVLVSADAITYGAGIYTDRLFVESNASVIKKLHSISKEIISDNCSKLVEELATNSWSEGKKEDVKNILFKYIHCSLVEEKAIENQNPITLLTPHLNALELKQHGSISDEGVFSTFFDRKETFLTKEAFGDAKSYPTILDISTKEIVNWWVDYNADSSVEDTISDLELAEVRLDSSESVEKVIKRIKRTSDKDQEKIVNYLTKTFKKSETRKKGCFKTLHKYIAIVQCDGDGIGSKITAVDADINKLSDNLSKFSRKGISLVNKYGGTPVYAGGDDLLFFAPVVNGNRHLIELLQELDNTFKELFKDFHDPSIALSFGVSISYYKFPLGESLEIARANLFGKAKKLIFNSEDDKKIKNNVVITFQKHSGAELPLFIHLPLLEKKQADEKYKGNELNSVLRLIDKVISEGETLSSIIYKLRENQYIVDSLWKDSKELFPEKLLTFFNNSFNEKVHQGKKEFIQLVADIVSEQYQFYYNENAPVNLDKEPMKNIFSLLRLIDLLIEPNQER